MTAARLLTFLMAFQGLPMPFLTPAAPKWLLAVKEAVEPRQAHAAQIKRVMRGVVSFDLDDVVQSAALPYDVVLSKSIALVRPMGDTTNARDQNWFFTAQFEDTNTLAVDRGGGTSPASVLWQVIEFEDGVTVQRGITSMQATGASNLVKNISLPSTLTTSGCSPSTFPCYAVPIIQTRAAFTTLNQTHELFLLPTFTDASTLRLERKDATGTKAMQIVWQVAEFLSDATVQTSALTLSPNGSPATDQSVTANVGDLSNPLLFTYFNGDTAVNGEEPLQYAAGDIVFNTSPTQDQVRFTRFTNLNTALTGVYVQYYLVDFTDDATLTQQDTEAWGAACQGCLTIATNGIANSTPVRITTTANHGLATGDLVNIGSNAGSTNVVGSWYITVISATEFDLIGSTRSGAAASAGTIQPTLKVGITAVTPARTALVTTVKGTADPANSDRFADDYAIAADMVSSTQLATLRSPLTIQGASAAQTVITEFSPVTLTYPDGSVSQTLSVGAIETVTWKQSADVGAHAWKLQISTNGGGAYSDLSTGCGGAPWTSACTGATLSTGSAQWQVPDNIGSTVRLRLIDTTGSQGPIEAEQRRRDSSDADLKIRGTVTNVRVENGSGPQTVIGVGATDIAVKWSHTGSIGTVKIELDKGNDGTYEDSLATGVTGTADTWSWSSVPDSTTETAKIRVKLETDPTNLVEGTTSLFAIRPSVTVKAPTNTDQWLRGRTSRVTWCATGSVAAADIYFSSNSGAAYSLVSGGTGVGTLQGTNTATCPGALVKEYYWDWAIDPSTALTAFGKVKVDRDGDATELVVDAGPDAGDAAFDMIASVSLTGPATSTILRVAQAQDISWAQGGGSGLGNVRLKYCTSYTTNGSDSTTCQANPSDADWLQITTPDASNLLATDTPFGWSVPNAVGTNVGIMVQEIGNPTLVYDVRGPYTVKGKLTVTSPASGETLRVGGNKVIEWDDFGTIGTVYICLQKESSGACDYNILDAGTVPAGVPASDGTYNWTNIPDERCTVCNIKVYKAGDADLTNGVADLTDNFSLKGNISNVQTNQATYQINDTAAITWTAAPATWTANVKLQYSKDGTTWNDVMCELGAPGPAGDSSVVAANTSCNWVVPDADLLTNTDRIRVSVVGDEAGTNATSAFFTVNGNLDLTYPSENSGDAAQLWLVGEQKNITWNFQGASIGLVKLYYSKDNGADLYANVIFDEGASINASAGAYLWTLPNSVIGSQEQNSQIKLKLVAHTNANIASISAQPVTIRAQFTNLAPDGGITWAAGDTDKSVSWVTKGTVPLINCKYSTDGGTSYGGTIATGISNAGGCAWNPIDGPVDNDIKYRVESAANPSVIYLVSGAVNTIKGKVVVTSPDATNTGANSLKVGNNHTITWTPTGNIGNVSIFYAADGATWGSAIFTGVDGNAGNKGPWAVPDSLDLAADEKIKIECETTWKCDPAQSAAFNIKGTLDLVEPNNGEVYSVGGSPIAITWTSTGSLGDLNVYYDANQGADGYPNQINGAPVPYNANTGGCSVTPPQYCYSWTVPAATGNKYRVKVIAISDSQVVDTSLANFVVRGSLALVKPGKDAGNVESWAVDGSLTYGFTPTIDWTYNGVQFVDMHLDTNAGADSYPIAIATNHSSADKPYTWTIPGGQYVQVTSDTARVRIRDANDPLFVTSASTNNFKIKPILNLTAPAAAAKWFIGTQYLITWDAPLGSADNLKIEYSLDGGSAWQAPIAASVPATNLQYPWTPPSQASNTDTVIRISKVGDAVAKDDSAQFNLFADFTLNAPSNNAGMGIATTVPITWTPVGLPGASQLMYSTVASPGPGDWLAITGAENIADPVGTTSFNWTIPDAPSPTVRVRIFDKTYPDDVIGTSPQVNAIIGSITPVSSPPSNGEMIVGQPYTITWTRNGSITKFKIEYHDGTGWFPITPTFTTNYPNFTWNPVDDRISSTVKVRVSDYDNPAVFGETANTVKIKGSIDLTSPNGAETLVMGQPFTIKWAKTGSLGNVKLEYSKDDFASDVRTITASVGSDVCQDGGQTCPNYIWTPTTAQIAYADMNGDVLKVRVTSIGGVPVTDQSANAFKVVGAISNVQPSGSAVIWSKGDTTKSVTWNQAGSISTVNIRYKTASGDTFNKTIVLGHGGHAEGANAYAVPSVPDENSEDVWVEVSDAGNSAVKGQSAAAFSMRPVITVSAPSAGQNILVGSNNTNAVQWSLNGSIKVSTVNVVYQTDGGAFDKTIASNVAATDGQVNWNSVTNTLNGTQAKNLAVVKVVDTANASVFGLSPSFDIVGKIVVDAPTGSDNWQAGSSQSISWTPSGNLGNVKLYYFHDGAYEAIPGGTVAYNSSPFSWNPVPNQVENSTTIKIVDLDTEGTGDEVAGISAAYDLIGGFAFNPQPPATLSAGASHTITWDRIAAAEIPNAKLEFFDTVNGWRNIDYASTDTGIVSNSGSYGWTVPANVTCTACKFRVSDPNNFTPTVVLSSDFEIRAGIVVTSPSAGVKWTIGTGGAGDVVVDNNIDWTITGVVANVKLEYSKDGTFAAPHVIIGSHPAATKPYDWAIPTNQDILSAGNTGKIRVSDASLAVVYGTSAGFMVKSGVTVTRPNTSDILKVGDAFNIQWTTLSTGADMGTLDLKFSKTGSAPWTTVASVAYSSSPYTLWAPGNGDITANAKAAKVRIEDADNAADVFDESDAFEIEGKITLDAPNTSNLKWPIGTNQDIKWTPTGTYANVKLHYAKNYGTDGFSSAVLINTVANSASGVQSTYSWAVPAGAQDDDLRIRVSDDLDLNVNDFSDFSIKILPALTLTAPQSGEVWYKGDTNKTITWTTGTGVVTNVKLEYKTSGAGSYTTIVANDGGHTTAGVNNYTWALIPDEKTDDAYVQVTDVNHATDVFDEGNAPFSIRPRITVTSPILDQNVQVGTNNPDLIQWTIGGATTLSNVDVLYSVSGGAFNAVTGCQDVLATAGSCDWNGVPDALSGNVVIKVADSSTPANPNVFGLSPAFDILGKITVDSPTAGVNWKAGDTTRVISWTPSGTMGNLKIYYYHDGAYELLNTVPQSPSSYAWNPIPTQVEESTTIKIVDADTEGQGADEVAGVSGAFNLIGGFVFNPEPPATLGAGTSHTITWDRVAAAEIATAKLEVYNGSTWVNIDFASTNTGLVSNSGSYGWTVPTTVACTACKFRLSDPDNAGPTSAESAAFEIRPAIAVTAPTAGTKWTIGTGGPGDAVVDNNIDWTITGIVTNVKLEYSKDGTFAAPYVIIGSHPAATKPYDWAIPTNQDILSVGSIGKIRVSNASLAVVYGTSAAFMVKSAVAVTRPNGSDVPVVGTAFNVEWTTPSTGADMGTLDLKFSKTGGAPWTAIASVAYDSSPYTLWAPGDADITAAGAATAKFRIEDADNAADVFGESAAFAVKGNAVLTTPSGGTVSVAGNVQNVVWDRVGNIGLIDLAYSVNDGSYVTIISGLSSPGATGNTYGWTVPTDNIVSTNVKVRLTGSTLAAPVISPAFTVRGNLTLTYPDAAGIDVSLGDTLNATWNTAGDIGPVKVEYFDGSAWTTVTTTAPQNGPSGFVLDTPTTTVATAGARVRITDADNAAVTDTSANAFTVRPQLAITSPVASDAWVVGSAHPITWTRKGSNITNVKLEYSSDNFTGSTVLFGGTTPNDGTEGWTIPDDIQPVPNLKMKISSLPTSDPFAASAITGGNFQIIGALEMTQPDDTTGVKWRVGSSGNEIKWTATGSIINAKLEYSTNSGGAWSTVVASTPSGAGSNKSYDWSIPGTVAPTKDTVRFRVSDAANTNVLDVGGANSSLLANFTFLHPLAGEVWVAQTSRDIEWTTPTGGVPANVQLEYKLSDAGGWQVITSSTTNSGIRSWTLPSGLSQTAKVRISDVGDADSGLESAAFKIRGDLVLTAPNTGLESWEIGTVHAVTWTKQGDLTAVKLQISTDGGTNYAALVDGDAADTQNINVTGAGPYTFNWKVPDVAGITSTTVRLRVVDATDATVYDSSNANFTIKGRVQLTTPNGSETLTVGVPYAVTGSVFGPIPSVKLFYSTNGGSTYDYAVENCATVAVSGGLFSCNWAVPDRLGPNVMVKVEDAANALVSDPSDAVFAIKGNAAITAPITGNVWYASNLHQITWDRTGTIGNVNLSYSVNNGAYTTIANDVPSPTPSGNSFDWTLPSDNIVSTNVKVKIDGVNLVAPAVSNAITVKGKLTLTYPDAAGLSFTLGDTANVTWTAAGDVGPIKVEYYNGAAWATLTLTAPQAGPYALLLDAPNTTVATAGAKVRISDPDDATVADESANAFTVRPLLALTAPAGGEAWVVNSFHDVTWAFNGSNIATVKLEYSTDGGSSYAGVIANSTANDGTHAWQIPDAILTVPNAKVRISSLPTSDAWAVTAVSNGLFKIVGALTLTTPQGTDRWGVGTTHDIKWQRTGSIPNIRLTYSTDGSTYNPIVDSYPGGNGDTGYPWTIPNVAGIVSNTVTVRISDSADSSVNNVSPVFKIVPSFTVTAPVLDQRVTVSRPFTITWSRQGQNPTIDLYYSLDGFSGPGIAISLAETNDGAYDWAVPDQAGLSAGFVPANVRVAYPDDATVFDDSDEFRLVSGFTMVSPNSSADKWDVGSSQTIRWTATSANVPQVKLEYSVDGGVTYPFVITNGTSNAGAADAQRTYVWNPLPDTITDQFRVRVTATNDASATDASDSNAKMKAFFQLLTPSAAGIVLKVTQAYNLTWNWTGSVGNVRLDYSKDDFATAAINIVPSTSNDGVFEWTVPDDIADLVKIQVRSTTDVDAFDRSDSAFKIRGDFLVTAPNGGNQFMIGFPHDIAWQTTGNITSVNLAAYSTLPGDTGFPYTAASPYTIVNGLASTPNGNTTYSWNPVPDLASPNVRVRVISAADPTVYDDSDANFKIQGSFTVTFPNGGETFTVNTTRTVTWNRTGSSISQAKLSYSTASAAGPWTTVAETEGTVNDGIVANDGTFDWVVPDALSATAWFRVEDPNDSVVSDASDSPFRIGAGFTFVTPAGGERWVTNEVRTVSWNTVGSAALVNLLYSKDNFTTSTVVANGLANAAGLNTYGWTIPNDLSATVKLRLVDDNDAGVYADSAAFTINHYQITFNVRDLLSNAHIDSLTVSAVNQSNNAYTWNASGLTSPITIGLPAGAWVATFTQNAYGDQGVSFVADQDQALLVLMETKIVHIYEAKTTVAYDALTDTMGLGSTLNRDGIVVSGVNFCEIKIYDPTSPTPDSPIKVFTNNGVPDTQGFYNFTWAAPTGLATGKVYNVRTQINVATTGAVFITPSLFSVTQEKTLKAVKDEVETKLDVPLSQVRQDVQDVLQTGVDQITATLTDFNTTVADSITELQNAAAQSLVSAGVLEDAALSSAAAAQTLKDVALTQSSKLLVPQDATTGLPLVIRWRGPSGEDTVGLSLAPTVKVENSDNQIVVPETAMSPVSGAENLYEYVIDVVAAADYPPGRNISVTVQEPTIGNFIVGTIFIKRPDGRLLMKTTAKIGEKISIQLAGADNWTPMIELSSDGVVLTAKQQMAKVSSDGKVTTFEFQVPESLGSQLPIGKSVIAIVTEPLTGFFDQGAFQFTATSLDDLSGQIAAGAGQKSIAQQTLDAVKTLEGELSNDGNLGQKLETIKQKIDRIPKAVADEGNTVKMKQAINEVADRITQLAGEDGYDFSELIVKGLEESESVKDIRKKTDQVQGATEVMQILVENKLGGVDDPVVHVLYE